jgi:hypothetical protein
VFPTIGFIWIFRFGVPPCWQYNSNHLYCVLPAGRRIGLFRIGADLGRMSYRSSVWVMWVMDDSVCTILVVQPATELELCTADHPPGVLFWFK